ncbi:hypothetical protein SAMN05661012_01080 [Chitinophaga sancti]|uniref:Uncharacterized protein n=1 Tax=Chitinophaga sancti TaxID=1004 RepID=A0A1K1NC74_9BACT|nr:hypothetical protein SAMN05661012_01080 [Chitinophaga sancti]
MEVMGERNFDFQILNRAKNIFTFGQKSYPHPRSVNKKVIFDVRSVK